MAEFLTTHATAYHIENIIRNAKERLVLVSPYLQVSKTFMDRLKDADGRGVKTTIIFGKDQLQPGEKSQLNELSNLSLMYCENLHAKCYFNEDHMVITSMNMYEFSEKTNREMGVLITKATDGTVYKDAEEEIESIKRASRREGEASQPIREAASRTPVQRASGPKPDTGKATQGVTLGGILNTIFGGDKLDGHCIRCGDKAPYDTAHPLCSGCFDRWNEHKNPDYREHFCHKCGQRKTTTKARPECSSCFSRR